MIDIAKIQQAILLTQQGKIQEAKNIYENEKLTKQNIEAMDRVRSQMVSLQAEIAKGNEKLAKGQSKIVNQIRFK